MPAVAMCDNGNLFGALEFSLKFSKEGIQPIIACDMLINLQDTIAATSSTVKIGHDLRQIVLIVQSEEGYLNLMSLVSQSYLKRQVGVPVHITLKELAAKCNGLLALSGGVKGIFGEELINHQPEQAEAILQQFLQLFPNNRLYIELQRHGLAVEENTEQGFIDLAYKYNVPLVATNDVYFMNREMQEAQDILKCIGKGWYISQQERERLTAEHYFKSSAEMEELFADIPEAIENTLKIAQRCHYMAYARPPTLPHFDLPEGVSEAEEMTRIAKEGLEKRLKAKFALENIPPEQQPEVRRRYEERLEMELKIIIQMDFPGYFLIVADFINWSKDHDIPIGPGRGSGAGSIVAWAMRITDIDSLRFNLFFERFLNPERVSMPDFDVDLCQAGRREVIKYVQRKYGEDMVANIIAFGTLKAKAVLKDVGRVLQMSYSQVDKICKLIPFSTAETITLDKAIEMDASLQEARDSDPETAHLIKIALQLEGLNRHATQHAAGVVIGFRPLEQIVALYRDEVNSSVGNGDESNGENDDMPIIGYSMKYAETVGLVKFDFLGLKTLTVIKTAVNLIQRVRGGEKILMSEIGLDDPKVYELLVEANTVGVFQLESSGMCSILKQMKPNRIEDIIALISLYRPGPMDSIPTYIKCKNGEEEIHYLHPLMEGILKETYGVIVYQEQVMEIAKTLAGYTLGGADLLRRAMGKKIKEEMDKQRSVFVAGCQTNNINEQLANDIFDLLAKFASYGFNKSHAAAYAVIGYQTAWLKYYYPVEFMAANMNLEIHDSDKLNVFRQDLVDNGIRVLPPDINKSEALFSVEELDTQDFTAETQEDFLAKVKVRKYNPATGKELAVRFGLGAIKAVGVDAMQRLIDERNAHGPFTDLFNLCERLDNKIINKKSLEALAKAGALRSIHANAQQIFSSVENLVRYTANCEADRHNDQISLFAGSDVQEQFIRPVLANVEDWQGRELMQKEFEAFGYYLTAHPLDIERKALDAHGIVYSNELDNEYVNDNCTLKMAGVVSEIRHRSSSGGGRFAYVYLSDPYGLYETTIFNDELIARSRDLMENGREIVIECFIRKEESNTRILIRDMWALGDFVREPANHLQGAARVKPGFKKNEGGGKWKKNEDGSWSKLGENGETIRYNPATNPRTDEAKETQEKVGQVFQRNRDSIQANVRVYGTATIMVKGKSFLDEINLLLNRTQSLAEQRNLMPTKITLVVKFNGDEIKLKLPEQYYLTENYVDLLRKILGVIRVEVE